MGLNEDELMLISPMVGDHNIVITRGLTRRPPPLVGGGESGDKAKPPRGLEFRLLIDSSGDKEIVPASGVAGAGAGCFSRRPGQRPI